MHPDRRPARASGIKEQGKYKPESRVGFVCSISNQSNIASSMLYGGIMLLVYLVYGIELSVFLLLLWGITMGVASDLGVRL